LRYRTCCCEAGLQDQVHDLVVRDLRIRFQQIQLVGLATNRIDIEALAVIGNVDDHFRTFAVQADRDSSDCRFASGLPLRRILDSVNNRVSQHVLERWKHLVQHLAIELARRALYSEFGALARFLGNLAYQPGEARYMTLKRHHPGAH